MIMEPNFYECMDWLDEHAWYRYVSMCISDAYKWALRMHDGHACMVSLGFTWRAMHGASGCMLGHVNMACQHGMCACVCVRKRTYIKDVKQYTHKACIHIQRRHTRCTSSMALFSREGKRETVHITRADLNTACMRNEVTGWCWTWHGSKVKCPSLSTLSLHAFTNLYLRKAESSFLIVIMYITKNIFSSRSNKMLINTGGFGGSIKHQVVCVSKQALTENHRAFWGKCCTRNLRKEMNKRC